MNDFSIYILKLLPYFVINNWKIEFLFGIIVITQFAFGILPVCRRYIS